MTENVAHRVAAARSLVAKVWKLAAPYWWADDVGYFRILGFSFSVREKWVARGVLASVIALSVFIVYMNKKLNDWNRSFFDSLQNKDQAAFFASLKLFMILVVVWIIAAVYRQWIRQLLQIRWRKWLTESLLRSWLADRTYYRMELTSHGTDNPEQRIEDDINSLTRDTLFYIQQLLQTVLNLVTFTVVLWNLSSSFELPLFGGLHIPGYMMWVALIYSVLGSWLTYKIGRGLIGVNFNLQRYNADFRYRMFRIRDNAESVALYHGEVDETRRLGGAFGRIYETWWRYMTLNKRLTWLTSFYGQAAGVFPFIVAAPLYFAGRIPLGVLTQTASAFGYVQESLSWFVDNFSQLTEWQATVDRLTTFSESMERTEAEARRSAADLHVETARRPEIELDDVQVALPHGQVLLDGIDLRVRAGQKLVVQGPSGSGKTTLFRVLAGIWPFAKGSIRLPADARVLFLPQRPYIPIGTLREALSYPDKPEQHSDARVREALAACGLGHLDDRLDEADNWFLTLSGGEQQRLSFARALLVKPDWLFLDEATSALDEPTETALYQLLSERLPGATVVSIAHKPGVARFHDQRLRIDPARRRVVQEAQEAAAEPA